MYRLASKWKCSGKKLTYWNFHYFQLLVCCVNNAGFETSWPNKNCNLLELKMEQYIVSQNKNA